MTHEFKLIDREESIVVREDDMIEAAAKVLKGAVPGGPGIDWPDDLDSEQLENVQQALARRSGHRIGRKTAMANGNYRCHFYRLGEPKKRPAKAVKADA